MLHFSHRSCIPALPGSTHTIEDPVCSQVDWIHNCLQSARKALEPAEEGASGDGEEELLGRRKPLGAGVPRHWGTVRAACVDGILSLSTNSNSHADVWDAAARLLSDHHR